MWTGTIAFVRGVIAASTLVSSRFRVSGRMSTKTGVAPRRTNAFRLESFGLGTEGDPAAADRVRDRVDLLLPERWPRERDLALFGQ